MKLCFIVNLILKQDLKSLKNVVTSKKEKKKDPNFSKMPESNIISYSDYIDEPKIEVKFIFYKHI